MAHDREVAGIHCSEVLEVLSDYVDEELDPGTAAKVEAHLAGCDWCERFGGEFAETLVDLRAHLGEPGEVDPDVARRLLDRLRRTT